jgi:hypothetical protein
MVKAGSMEKGLVQAAEVATPHGAMLSPLLSKVSLHYGLAIGFHSRMRRHCRGEADVYRCADAFGACCPYQPEAEDFLESRGKRRQEVHRERAPEKTRHLAVGR